MLNSEHGRAYTGLWRWLRWPARRRERGERRISSGRRGQGHVRGWETASRERRLALAGKAIGISPDCADAYVLLAEETAVLDEALDLYRLGVEAGERALGKDAFETDAGNFWLILETRPYIFAHAADPDAWRAADPMKLWPTIAACSSSIPTTTRASVTSLPPACSSLAVRKKSPACSNSMRTMRRRRRMDRRASRLP